MWVITNDALICVTPTERTNIPWSDIIGFKESATEAMCLSACGKRGATQVKMITATLTKLNYRSKGGATNVETAIVGVNCESDFLNKLTAAHAAAIGNGPNGAVQMEERVSTTAQLLELENLHKTGLITEYEYQEKRKAILAAM